MRDGDEQMMVVKSEVLSRGYVLSSDDYDGALNEFRAEITKDGLLHEQRIYTNQVSRS